MDDDIEEPVAADTTEPGEGEELKAPLPTPPKRAVTSIREWALGANASLNDQDDRLTALERRNLILLGGVALVGVATLLQGVALRSVMKGIATMGKAVVQLQEVVQGFAAIPTQVAEAVKEEPPKEGPVSKGWDPGPMDLSPQAKANILAEDTSMLLKEPDIAKGTMPD